MQHFCSKPGCQHAAANCGGFCRYHRKFEFLRLKVAHFKSFVDPYGEWLADAVLHDYLGSNNKSNSLQPNGKYAANCPIPTFADLNGFLDFFVRYLDILRAPLGITKVDGQEGVKVLDQANRGVCLKNLLRSFHDCVRLMDGRGSLLLMFLLKVREFFGVKRLNSLRIELVDIDPKVTAWHKQVFRCPNIVCLTENIVSLGVPVPKTTLLYFNFCGISASYDHIVKYLKTSSTKTECMLSFSTGRRAQCKDFDMALIATLSRKKYYCLRKLPSPRADFSTWVIGLTQDYADLVDAKK